MSKLHIKTGDTVTLLTGDKKDRKTDNGKMKTGKVLQVSPSEGKVIVEKRNMVTKHVKARRANDPSGIVQAEGALYACKVKCGCNKLVKVFVKVLSCILSPVCGILERFNCGRD